MTLVSVRTINNTTPQHFLFFCFALESKATQLVLRPAERAFQ